METGTLHNVLHATKCATSRSVTVGNTVAPAVRYTTGDDTSQD